ncbi:MAG: transglutaminase TgpA family protein [Ardenticatenaceae bacterium]
MMPERLQMREGWFALLLLFLLLFTITLSLEAAKWAPGLNILFSVFLMAFLVGVFFAKSRLSGLLMHPLALAIGTCWIGFMSLSLVEENPWEEQLTDVVLRLVRWGQELSGGETSTDTLPFVVLMAVLVWLIAYSSTWYFFREHNIWGVLLPSGMTILVNTYYANSQLTFLLLIYLILAFLLVIRMNLIEQEERWRRSDIFYNADIQFDFFRDGAVFAVAIVVFAWVLPTAVTNTDLNPYTAWLNEPWGRAQQEWNRIFSALNYRGSAVNGTWFRTSMNFHGPLNRSDRLVMNVSAETGRYWRAVVLDKYTSAGWAVSQKRVSEEIAANNSLSGQAQLPPGRRQITQKYTIFAPAGILLFAAGQPLDVDLPAQVLYGGPAAQNQPGGDEISQIYARQGLYQGQSYTARSAIPTVDIKSLRQAGDLYPQSIKEHYTTLPDDLPERVIQLADDVVGNAPTAYDKASTIEQYLRTIPYNETISGPNPGEDGVDYFLFREQQGYCDYYASSMAVMLRSQGIPARLAQGYSQGELLESGEYEVRQTNAHTWVEVYFPGYGWIEFEPTAAEPGIERPTVPVNEDDGLNPSDLPDPEEEEEDIEEEDPFERQQNEDEAIIPPASAPASVLFDPRILLIPLGILALFGMIGLIGWGAVQRRWRGLEPVERLYDQLSLMGRALGQQIDPRLTPHEYAQQISQMVPPVRRALTRLAELFSKQRFSGSSLEEEEIAEAQSSWLSARRPLLQSIFDRLMKRDK